MWFGGLVGVAAGAFYAPLTTTATRWFTLNRGLAVALVSAGTGLGTFVVAPLTRWLISTYDWRVAMLLLGDLTWLVITPLGLLIREAPGPPPGVTEANVPLRAVARSPQFWLVALTHFACRIAHSGPIFHMVTHAMDQGVPGMTAATILGISGLSSLTGRVLAGIAADRWGAKPTLITMLSLQAPAIALYLFSTGTGAFYALAVLFGASYGGVMPMYAPAHPRVLRGQGHGHRVRRHLHAPGHRHGAGRVRRQLGLRPPRDVRLVVRHGHGRGRRRHPVRAAPSLAAHRPGAGRGGGLTGRSVAERTIESLPSRRVPDGVTRRASRPIALTETDVAVGRTPARGNRRLSKEQGGTR